MLRRAPSRRRVARSLVWAMSVVGVGIVVVLVVMQSADGDPQGDPGELSATQYEWRPTDGELPRLADVSVEWGFSQWAHSSMLETSGGVAVGDLDGDGLADVVVAGGTAAVFYGNGEGFDMAVGGFPQVPDEVVSVTLDDVDADGALDVLLGARAGADVIVWGGQWARDRDPAAATTTMLDDADITTALLVADVNGDAVADVVRLATGSGPATAQDVLFVQTTPRTFSEPRELPNGDRRSLAGELADIDGDGLVDIWVTRDVGWSAGGDSLYSRRGEPRGPFTDIASAMRTDLEIDGMGVTLTDLSDDHRLDAVVSDLGDNEILVAGDDGFARLSDTGAERIRPPGAADSEVSSSWGTGVVDLNLDGRLDLVVGNGGFTTPGVANKIPGTEIRRDDPPAILLQRSDGAYADVWGDVGPGWTGAARGMATGDLDADGDDDLIFIVHGASPVVFRNDTAGPSLVIAVGSDCDLAGATVDIHNSGRHTVTLLRRHTFLSAHGPGLVIGTSQDVSVEVTAVDGRVIAGSVDAGSTRERLFVGRPAAECR